jgi:hypothetical protein
METLTLEHLSAYLPYGLMGQSKDGTIFRLGLNYSMRGCGIEDKTIGMFVESQFKPILYPLSSLTNEQIVDLGLIFREIDPHNATLKDKIFAVEDARGWLRGGMKPVMSLGQCQKAMNHLYSIKADIFNLIPKGLAVDVNTLETNPYK